MTCYEKITLALMIITIILNAINVIVVLLPYLHKDK